MCISCSGDTIDVNLSFVIVDRGLDATDRVASWAATRVEIDDAICTRGYRERLGAFTQTLEGDGLDAQRAHDPDRGAVPGMDPRVISTIEVLERELCDDHGLLSRYRGDDGLPAPKGGSSSALSGWRTRKPWPGS